MLNFYDKVDWVWKQRAEGKYISPEDEEYARNALRLEVQCGHNFLRRFCKKHKINCTFGDLFRYDLALKAEEDIYNLVFRCNATQDYYTYEAAKKLLPRSKAAKEVLFLAATNHSIANKKYGHGRKRIQQVDIYPYCFLPKGMEPERLENPIKLIQKKLRGVGIAG